MPYLMSHYPLWSPKFNAQKGDLAAELTKSIAVDDFDEILEGSG